MNILPKLSRTFICLLIVLSVPVFFILKDIFEVEINEYLFDTYTLKSIKHISETDPQKLDSLLNDNAKVIISLQDINPLRYNKEPLIVPLSAFDFYEGFDFLVVEKFLSTSNKILNFVYKEALIENSYASYAKELNLKHLHSFKYSKDVELILSVDYLDSFGYLKDIGLSLSFEKENLNSDYVSIDFFKFTMDIHKKYSLHTSKLYKEIFSNSKTIEEQIIARISKSLQKEYYEPNYENTLSDLIYLNKLKHSDKSSYLNSLLGNILEVGNIEAHISLLKNHHSKYSGKNLERLVNQFLINNMEEVKYAGFCYILIPNEFKIDNSILGKFDIKFNEHYSKFIFKPYYCDQIQNLNLDNISDVDNFVPTFQQTVDAKILGRNYIHKYKNLEYSHFGTVL